ncbi:MAG: DHH family phosphoesterase [Gammaproteobacteria bacterium]|nr:DHH family phosphoesterase [Gammaproteobacteria bacterium]NND39890.1 DHH family phosphoesterase [Pseudomonadales bacterium]MBT8151248.1 DHH family phosphoesterase [Gammaproteobacteria bacterium]NNL10816.1 DHH family phosphoesterase [Pseudomonadales bacterium]NNM12125.1 DHH family phosphoesterase [Pseudomonadales bacterium]
MAVYDVFNGDADGICALVQLRNVEPLESTLVTGVKRDIALLERVQVARGDRVNVLDISMAKNSEALARLLADGAIVFYCDHHQPGDIPKHPALDALINVEPNVCTSLLVNGRLNGAVANWAVVGAYGDNLRQSAEALARYRDLNTKECGLLENLGIYLNYNGYGASLDDLHFAPDELYLRAVRYIDPLAFISDDSETFGKLESGYHDDMRRAREATMLRETTVSAAVLLPNEKWARRVSGVYGNALANDAPQRAHAVLTERADNTYLVSVRAPLENKTAADQLCSEFPTGGGRKAAAGINALPAEMLERFLDRLDATYSQS